MCSINKDSSYTNGYSTAFFSVYFLIKPFENLVMTFCVISARFFLLFNVLCLFLLSNSVIFPSPTPISFFFMFIPGYFRFPIPSWLFCYHFLIIQVIYSVSVYFVGKKHSLLFWLGISVIFFFKKKIKKKYFYS